MRAIPPAAVTLGTPIFDGIVADKLPLVLKGAVLVALFAILADIFARLERRPRSRAGGGGGRLTEIR